MGKVLSKDVTAIEVGLSLIPPRTLSTNETTMLCHFTAGGVWLLHPPHQSVICEGIVEGGLGG